MPREFEFKIPVSALTRIFSPMFSTAFAKQGTSLRDSTEASVSGFRLFDTLSRGTEEPCGRRVEGKAGGRRLRWICRFRKFEKLDDWKLRASHIRDPKS